MDGICDEYTPLLKQMKPVCSRAQEHRAETLMWMKSTNDLRRPHLLSQKN